MKYLIYHANTRYDKKGNPIGIAGSFGWEATTFPDDFDHVADVEAESLDEAFGLTQHIDLPWQTDIRVDARIDNPRSTSVGDVLVRHDGKNGDLKVVVAPMGFESFAGAAVPKQH